MRKQRISLGSTLAGTRLLGVRDGTVRIGCADDFAVETITRNKDTLAGIFRKMFNISVRLEVEKTGEAPEPEDPPPSTGEEHPIISAMRRELGAEPL